MQQPLLDAVPNSFQIDVHYTVKKRDISSVSRNIFTMVKLGFFARKIKKSGTEREIIMYSNTSLHSLKL